MARELLRERRTTPAERNRLPQPAPARRATAGVWPSLQVGAAGDPFEQEAERVAQAVVGQVRRFPAAVSKASAPGFAASADVEAGVQAARGGGQPLPPALRSRMERAFGADFSGVRVHTDARAQALNRELNARAFSTGKDLFFGRAEYAPDAHAGQALIAHELTHVVQQSQAGPRVQRQVQPADVQVIQQGKIPNDSPNLRAIRARLGNLATSKIIYSNWVGKIGTIWTGKAKETRLDRQAPTPTHWNIQVQANNPVPATKLEKPINGTSIGHALIEKGKLNNVPAANVQSYVARRVRHALVQSIATGKTYEVKHK